MSMNLQFSIIGYAMIAAFYFICGAILFLLWVKFERKRWITPVLAVVIPIVLALPWVEEIWIAYNFTKLCDSVGVQVTRKVEVDGFYDDTMRTAYELIDQFGYTYMEHRSRTNGKIDHVQKIDGEWKVTKLDRPSARYHYRYSNSRQEVPITWKIQKVEKQIFDSESREVIARDRIYMRFPNVIEWQWIRFFGTGMQICRGPLNDPEKQKRYGSLYKFVLIPKQN